MMKHKIGIILAVIALLLSIMAGGCGKVTAITETEFNDVNSASIKSGNGLSLSVSLDAKTYQSGYAITIIITEYNTLSETNKIPAAAKWPIQGLSDGICGTEDFPFGVAIFQGNYTADNISTGTPLILDDPNVIVQGCMPSVFNVTAYNFKPSSDIASLKGDALDGSTTFEMSTKFTAGIYWVGSLPNAVQQFYPPGVYTVVAGDEWGNMVILHFTVTN
jgi:hypothetical protein